MVCRDVVEYAAHVDHSSLFATYLNNFAEIELNAYYLITWGPSRSHAIFLIFACYLKLQFVLTLCHAFLFHSRTF